MMLTDESTIHQHTSVEYITASLYRSNDLLH